VSGFCSSAGIRCEQNLRALELARRVPAAAEEGPEFLAFGLGEVDPTTYVHPCPCSLEARTNN
jgi:hypothetical protein